MTLAELEKKIQTLQDIEEIKKLQYNYCNYLILAKWDEVIDCFSDDGVVDLHAGFARGKAEFSKLFKEEIGHTHTGKEGNYAVHPIIDVDGDKARGSWIHYIQFAQPSKIYPKPSLWTTEDAPNWLQGFYDMEYKKVKGHWKISMLKWRCRLASPLSTVKSDKPGA
jgi:hypothetical protein